MYVRSFVRTKDSLIDRLLIFICLYITFHAIWDLKWAPKYNLPPSRFTLLLLLYFSWWFCHLIFFFWFFVFFLFLISTSKSHILNLFDLYLIHFLLLHSSLRRLFQSVTFTPFQRNLFEKVKHILRASDTLSQNIACVTFEQNLKKDNWTHHI